jgi:hypothetical protein
MYIKRYIFLKSFKYNYAYIINTLNNLRQESDLNPSVYPHNSIGRLLKHTSPQNSLSKKKCQQTHYLFYASFIFPQE